jgi:hypothetical protein
VNTKYDGLLEELELYARVAPFGTRIRRVLQLAFDRISELEVVTARAEVTGVEAARENLESKKEEKDAE